MKISLNKAIQIITAGDTVAIPTETVYGLAADAFNVNAVKKIFLQKGRPADNPLIVHISSLDQLQLLAEEIPEELEQLAERFWPGPLSLVLKKKKAVPDIVTAGLDTVAIRMPAHTITLQLINKTGPLTAPSANKSGRPSPTKPEHVVTDFGNNLPILDGGTSEIGLESTVLDLSGENFTILRPGYISLEDLENVTGRKIRLLDRMDQGAAKKSPGTRFTHYKPRATVKWLDRPLHKVHKSGTYIIIHSDRMMFDKHDSVHSYNKDYESLARDLYDHFRTADHLGCHTIYIEPFDKEIHHSLVPALLDRIERAIGT